MDRRTFSGGGRKLRRDPADGHGASDRQGLNISLCVAICCSTLVAAPCVDAAGPRQDHPFIGTWVITLPENSCHEIYRVRHDGTTVVTSADEVSESEYTVSDKPSAKGFYKWSERVTRDNGKPDCSGHITKVGHESTNFIYFHPSVDTFFLCPREDTRYCIGPFVRLKGSNV
jgi:hypothetical protein